MFETLLVAFDGSPESWRALDTGIDLAVRLGAELHAIIVEEDVPTYASLPTGIPEYRLTAEVIEAAASQQIAYYTALRTAAEQRAADCGLSLQVTVLPGAAVHTIAEFAKTLRCGLLIYGHPQHSLLYSRLHATTAQALACAAPCSVLAVKTCSQAAAAAAAATASPSAAATAST